MIHTQIFLDRIKMIIGSTMEVNFLIIYLFIRWIPTPAIAGLAHIIAKERDKGKELRKGSDWSTEGETLQPHLRGGEWINAKKRGIMGWS